MKFKLFNKNQEKFGDKWVIMLAIFFAGVLTGSNFSGQFGGKNIQNPSILPTINRSAEYPPREGRAECEILVCKNGRIFPTCACTDGVCSPLAYFEDPCLKAELIMPKPIMTALPTAKPTTLKK